MPQPSLLRVCLAVSVASLWAATVPGAEVSTNSPTLDLDRIFTSKEFSGKSFGPFQWRKHGGGYTTLEKPAGDEPGQDLVWHDPATRKKQILAPARLFIPAGESAPLGVSGYSFSEDDSKLLIYTNDKKVWRQRSRGDYWVLDLTSRLLSKLGGKAEPSTMMHAVFSPDGTRVCYVRENNLYAQDLRDLKITRLTSDGSETVINGRFDWVYEEELFLQSGFRWSADGKSVAYWQLDTSGVGQFSLVDDTDALYPGITTFAYPKTGERNPLARVGVVGAEGGATTWLKIPGDPRDHYIAKMDWAGGSGEILVQQFNRLQNTNLVMLADAKTGAVRTLLTETDAAWVENENKPWWTKDAREFVWLSERDGWQHAWMVSRADGKTSLITHGKSDVVSVVALDETNRLLYFMASPDNATQRYLFSCPLDGGKPRRLTPADQPGTHSYSVSPDAKWAVHTYSTFDRPPVTDLISLPDHKRVEVLEENLPLRSKVDALARSASEFFRVDAGAGVTLDGWCVKPPNFNPAKKYPVLFHIYGEPAGQTVLDHWGGDNHLWSLMLAQQGYVVMSVDNQGTPAPRGREWRKAVYRRIGSLASEQQAAAVRALTRSRSYLDPGRVAVWGWSGGGSMSLNLIFRQPEVYQTAMAVAPVPNIRYYDSIYEERYMGLPQDHPDDYRESSPITFAGQLKGNLLLVHGTGDDNVHFQGSEALINELVALNKPFTMMAYPNRTHAISEGRNTRRHLYGLLTDYLRAHTPPNP